MIVMKNNEKDEELEYDDEPIALNDDSEEETEDFDPKKYDGIMDEDTETAIDDEILQLKEERKKELLEQKKKQNEQKRLEHQEELRLRNERKLAEEEKKRAEFEQKAHKKALEKNKTEEEKAINAAQKRKEKILASPKLSKKLRKKLLEVNRIEADTKLGLSEATVEERINQGLNNFKSVGSTKTISQIIISNIFTFFNLLTFVIAGFLISINSIKDLTFLVIVLANMIIGTVQEIRAKLTIDKLSILSAPSCNVLREGKVQEVSLEEVVLDDLLVLDSGKQICSDSILVDGQIEVNESLLTGEADAIVKHPGDILYSGSFVVSGRCIARVDKVGSDNYIERLSGQAKQYRKPNSELLKSLKRIIMVMGCIIIPTGIALFLIQYMMNGLPYETCIRKTAGAMIGMIPSGLYLVTSVALAVGVLRLGKQNVLVQELYCIEMLARVDVLCLDKTGTITDGSMSVKNVIDYDIIKDLNTKQIVSAMLNATNDMNLTNVALEEKFGRAKRLKHSKVIPFSSQRKYSAATFDNYGTFVLGAPEFILKKNYKLIESDVNKSAKEGYRVLLIAHSFDPIADELIPNNLEPVALILIEDNVRPDAIKTIDYFKKSGVEVKVISGDNPVTVSKVAERAGIDRANEYISLDGLTDTEVVRAAAKYTVFGRVSPSQKKLLVQTLQELGHKVAMTGDGVNDILALKEADCSIAIASGSEAARNVSHLVLLDSNFNSMPKVVQEGRRVISNVAKVAKLYLTKTIFSLLLTIVALIQGSYPISTNQLLMIDFLCIGLPSVILVLEPNNEMAPKNFLSTIIKSALPGAIVIVIQSILVFLLQSSLDMSSRVTSTIICITATFTCMMVLYETCKPFNNSIRKWLFGGCFSVFVFATLLMPSFFDFSPTFAGMQYYSKTEEVITWETQVVSISESNHYTVDGYVLEELCVKPTTTHTAEVNSDGYLVVDNVVVTNHKPSLPDVTCSSNGKFVFGAYETPYVYLNSNTYSIRVSSDGTVFIVYEENDRTFETKTMYNILPEVSIIDNYYYVDGYNTMIRTTNTKVGKVSLQNNYDVYIDGEPLNYQINNGEPILISHKDGKLWLDGDSSDIDYDESLISTLSIKSKEYYINDIATGVNYLPEIDITSANYYIVNGMITEYKCKGTNTTIIQSLTSDGYLKIDGVVTNIKVDSKVVYGGQVAVLPMNCIILLIALCLASHPLIFVIKSVVPFSKKQFKKLTDILNRI